MFSRRTKSALIVFPGMSLDLMAERTSAFFARCFGHPPRWLVAAPGRVNLIGEHTDYNDGFVLPMAIEQCTLIAADTNNTRNVTLHSITTGETATFSLRGPVERGEPPWSNYVRGVLAGFQQHHKKLPGLDVVIESSLPYAGGLASSAALEVAMATVLEVILEHTLESLEKALLCQRAEHEFAGNPCGIMDQFTCIRGQKDRALLLDCRSLTMTPIEMTDESVTVLIVNTNVRRSPTEGRYKERRRQCEAAAGALKVQALRDATLDALETAQGDLEPEVFRRAHRIVTENARTLDVVKAIASADWNGVGELMYLSHVSLRDDYEVSCPRVGHRSWRSRSALARRGGMLGCRMTGAGFGGCAVGLVRTEAAPVIKRKIDHAYEKKSGRQADIFSSRPSDGVRILK